MDADKQQIIDKLSKEIGKALISCEYHRHEQGTNPDKTDANISSYAERVKVLRKIREQLENEFTVIHYDPR